MTSDKPLSKTELLRALHDSRDEVLRLVRSLPPARLEEGRYEGGWNGRQILAHIAAIEWTFPRLIDVAREERPASAGSGESLPTRPMQGGVDAYNERQVAKRAHLPAAELVDEFLRNRAATIAAVEKTDDALLARGVRSAAGVTGSLARVLYAVTVDHALGHARDIAGR